MVAMLTETAPTVALIVVSVPPRIRMRSRRTRERNALYVGIKTGGDDGRRGSEIRRRH